MRLLELHHLGRAAWLGDACACPCGDREPCGRSGNPALHRHPGDRLRALHPAGAGHHALAANALAGAGPVAAGRARLPDPGSDLLPDGGALLAQDLRRAL